MDVDDRSCQENATLLSTMRPDVKSWLSARLLENVVVLVTEASPIGEPGPKIVFANEAFQRLTGYAPEEAIGRSPRFLQGTGTSRAERDRIRDALAQQTPVQAELLNYKKDGSPFWVEMDIVPLTDPGSGTVTHFLSVVRDITDVKSKEELLDRFTRMLDEAPDAIMLRDLKDRILYWNKSAERLYGWTAEEAKGRHISDLLGLDRKLVEQTREETRKNGRWTGRVTTTVPSDSSLAIRRVSLSLIPGRAGEDPTIASIHTDITDQVRLEERMAQNERLEALGQLTGGIAHDFNNLLTILIGSTDIALRRAADRADIVPLLQMSRSAAERGANLVKRLLAFARRQPLDPEPTDVNRLIADMEKMLKGTLGGNIIFEHFPTPELWLAEVDAPQLENAILNLCINARDAMQPAGGRIIIETANMQLDGNFASRHGDVEVGAYVMIAITDTGCGMSKETLGRIFEPFFTTKEGGGNGLGLSMVHGFIKQSGGQVVVYSEPGLGTTVRLYLPRSSETSVEQAPAVSVSIVGGTETVLLVEDDDLVRRHASSLLTDLGYTVFEAENGPAALQFLEEEGHRIDLLLTDVVMPGGMDGLELARTVRERYPDMAVLYTSGFTDHSVYIRGILRDGAPFLRKPYRIVDLATKLRTALSGDDPASARAS